MIWCICTHKNIFYPTLMVNLNHLHTDSTIILNHSQAEQNVALCCQYLFRNRKTVLFVDGRQEILHWTAKLCSKERKNISILSHV